VTLHCNCLARDILLFVSIQPPKPSREEALSHGCLGILILLQGSAGVDQ
jgi:hypothetical protein